MKSSILACLIAIMGATPALAMAPAAAALPATTAPVIAIQPLGEIDPSVVQKLSNHFEAMLDARVIVLPKTPLPRSAYYAPRNRYRGPKILDHLEARVPANVTKVLGVMSRDLSATKKEIYDWGILGIAGLSRRAAVVSIHRLNRHRVGPAKFEKRLNQVATHELGHTYGISHCKTARCLMNDACGSIRTVDRSSGKFCANCRRRMADVLEQASDATGPAGAKPRTPAGTGPNSRI